MKIVDRKTFLEMPENIVFNKYDQGSMSVLCIKGETWGNDFTVQYLDNLRSIEGKDYIDAIYELEDGKNVPMDFDCMGRDGCFDDDQLFAVWEKQDIVSLIERLKQCVTD